MPDYVSEPEKEIRKVICCLCGNLPVKIRVVFRWEGDALGTYEGKRCVVPISMKVISGLVIKIDGTDYHVCSNCKKKNWWAKLGKIILGKRPAK